MQPALRAFQVEVDYDLVGGGCAPYRAWVVGAKAGELTLAWQGTFEVEAFRARKLRRLSHRLVTEGASLQWLFR